MSEKPTYEELEQRVRRLEKALSECRPVEKPMVENQFMGSRVNLVDLVDISAIQSLMDDFYDLTGIGIAILDLAGNTLVAKGWQDICVKFHRVHPETSKNCIESDLELSNGIKAGTFRLYQCKNNMLDMATPIMVGDQKVGNLYLGQFLFDDKPLDVELFRAQARKYGFDEQEYIDAVMRVPRWSRETVNAAMRFYTQFANLISDIGYKHYKLSESELRYRELVENLNDVIYSVDNVGMITYLSPPVKDILGYTASELVGKNFEELIHYDDLTHIQETFKKVLNGKLEPSQYRIKTKGGGYRWVRTSSRPVFKGRAVVGLQGVLTDVTAYKRSEENLKRIQHELKAILDSSPALIWQKDTQGRYVQVNNKYCDTVGLCKEMVVGKTDYDIFPHEIADKYAEDDRFCIDKEISKSGIVERHIKPSGEPGWSRTDKIIWRDADGKVSGTIGFAVDISNLKKSEATVKLKNKMLNSLYLIRKTMDDNTSIEVIFRKTIDLLAESMNFPEATVPVITYNGNRFIQFELTEDVTNGLHADLAVDGETTGSLSVYYRDNRQFLLPDEQEHIDTVAKILSQYLKRESLYRKLKERDSQYNAIVENTSDYIMRYDSEFRHIFANQKAADVTGLTMEEFLGKTHREMGFPEDLCALWEENIQNVFETGEVKTLEFDVELKDGVSSLELQLNPEFDEHGTVLSVIGISRNITDRKKREQEIKTNKLRMEIIHEIATRPEAREKQICDIVLERMLDLSKSEIGFLGYINNNEKEMEIHSWSVKASAACTIQDKPVVFPIAESGLWGEPVRNRKPLILNNYLEYHAAKKGFPEGHIHINRFMAVPVFEGNTIVAIAAVGNKRYPYNEFDVEQLELLLNSWWENIRRKRIDRDRERLHERLQQAQKMESIGNLAGGIAHDFNNILFPIIGMAEMLLEDLPPDSIQYENSQEILTAGKRGSDLIKQILAFSRQNEHKLIPVQVQQVLREVLKLSRSTIPSDIEISQYIQNDCGLVKADPTQLHQIAMNLITNAYHAVDNTNGKIDIKVKEITLEADNRNDTTLQPGQYVLLSVADNGCGIPQHIMHKIFEPYFTTKKKGKGTGLGLSVVYGIVKEHLGDIKVYSETGKGTTFNVYLPLMQKFEGSGSADKTDILPMGNEKILLVDDEEPIVRLERQMLERLGYNVTEQISSIDALRTFKEKPDAFDLVITDMTMPNMSGDLLARELITIRPDISVIICTGFSERINKEVAESLGIKGFLMKPVIKSAIAQEIRRVLDGSERVIS